MIKIDAASLAANWQLLQDKVKGECGAAVKANGYGLGIENVVPVLAKAGCQTFFVAHAKEAAAVRPLAREATIIVMHGIQAGQAALFKEFNLTPALKSHEDLKEWQAPAWLHVDTGMNRLGFDVHDVPDYPHTLGVMSHFACSDERMSHMNNDQLKKFRAVRARFPTAKASLCNSSGIFLGEAYHFDVVRPGVALYGVNPTPDEANPMQRVVNVSATVLQTRQIAEGETVGYGASWIAERPTKLATIECGYADGLLRSLSGRGYAYVGGTRVPFAGRVSMDMIVLDVTDAPPVKVGDTVELIGQNISADDVAHAAGTIGYEVLTNLKARLF